MSKTDLILHYYPQTVFRQDFDDIAKKVETKAPDIRVRVLATDHVHVLPIISTLLRPSVSVAFGRAKFFPRLRGRAYRQWHKSSKSQQYRVLDKAGVPVPKWAKIVPDLQLSEADWGRHVIEKPDRGGRGAYVRVKRTNRVGYRESDDLEPDNPGRDGGMLVQQMICTGEWPVSYRVATLFGTPLVAIRYQSGRGQLFSDPSNGPRKLVGATAVATGVGAEISTVSDRDLLDLARLTHQAFPDVPVLGIDLVRDVDDGKLWVLEVNPDGSAWPLGSPLGRSMMESTGLDLYNQFNGLDKAAETLIDLCGRKVA